LSRGWDSSAKLSADEGVAFDDEAQRVFDGLAGWPNNAPAFRAGALVVQFQIIE
jgi:hypothetical protein